MTSFEAGFIKYSEECGLSLNEAVHMLKRAFEHPGAQEMFKHLPQEEQEHSPEEMDTLANMLQQELMHSHMSGATQKVQM